MSATPRPLLYQQLDYLGSASAYRDDVLQVIRNEPLFGEFSPQEIGVLCEYMHCFAASRDVVILEEDRTGDHLLILLSGKVVVRKRDSRGTSIVIAEVDPGSVLGEMSLFDGERRFATCTTVEPTDFAVMTRSDLNEMLLAHPRMTNKFLIKMLQIMVGRVRELGIRVVENLPGHII